MFVLTLFSDMNCGPDNAATLRELADKKDLFIGGAVNPRVLKGDSMYASVLGREFNILTPENAMKWKATHPESDRYDFTDADAMVSFAREHTMKVRGHTLVWHNGNPDWLKDGTFTPVEYEKLLKEHIATVAGHYKGKLLAWDVVNEGIRDKPPHTFRESFWYKALGPSYIDSAFFWTHQADPNVKLFYNDYGAEGMNGKSDAIYQLVKGMLDRKIPIHGVGLQMHISLNDHPPLPEIAANIKRLNDLGLDIHITELDIRLKEPVTPEQLEQQAQLYGKLLNIARQADNCPAFVLWGFTDKYSWVPHFFKGFGQALLFDKEYEKKPAYQALIETLK